MGESHLSRRRDAIGQVGDPWTEKVVDGAILEIELEGFDADRQDALEASAMLDAVSARREAADSFDRAFWRGWSGSTMNLAGVLAVVGILVGLLCLRLGHTFFPEELADGSLGALLQVLMFFAGFAVPIFVAARILQRRPPALAFPTERFKLRLDAKELKITSASSIPQRIALADIVEFQGDRRLSIVKSDGTTTMLAVSLLAAKRHPDLAARLNEEVRGTRARVGLYRGPRIATDADEVEDVVESDAAELARRKR